MPLWMGYDDELGSKVADLNNVAASGSRGGYLRRAVPQALRHRDGATGCTSICTAWNAKERPGRGVGAEAQAVRGVYCYLVERYGTV